LIQWANEWQMMFNTSKCKVMHFGKKELNNVEYYMSDQCLTTVTEKKDLGVVISSDMKSSQQCIQAYSKASRTRILEMWANAQPDGRPAEHRWRPLFNAAKFG